MLIHVQQPDKREVQEHQLAAVEKVDKQSRHGQIQRWWQ